MICDNRSLYLIYKDKFNWVESEPSHFNNDSARHQKWYKSWGNGKDIPYHREDGPARMWEDGFVEYWYNGTYYKGVTTLEEFIIKRLLE